jgi:hypothetical protein
MKLPGINTKNIRRVLNKVEDLGQLISLSLVNIFITERNKKFVFKSSFLITGGVA